MGKTIEFESRFSGKVNLELEINTNLNNGRLYIGLNEQTEDYLEPYADLTVNINGVCPDYCGYVDINNMPELEQLIEENELGEFTGIMGQSGFCNYPLYLFSAEKLREYCPDGMQMYENRIGKVPEQEPERKR